MALAEDLLPDGEPALKQRLGAGDLQLPPIQLAHQVQAVGDLWMNKIDEKLASYRKSHPEQVKVADDAKFTGLDAYKKVIDSGVDVVLLTTPPAFRWLHFKYAVAQNKHVFAEKPLYLNAVYALFIGLIGVYLPTLLLKNRRFVPKGRS